MGTKWGRTAQDPDQDLLLTYCGSPTPAPTSSASPFRMAGTSTILWVGSTAASTRFLRRSYGRNVDSGTSRLYEDQNCKWKSRNCNSRRWKGNWPFRHDHKNLYIAPYAALAVRARPGHSAFLTHGKPSIHKSMKGNLKMEPLPREVTPIRIFGAVLVVFALAGAYFVASLILGASSAEFSFRPTSPSYYGRVGFYFAVGVLAFYLLTGVGVMLLAKWGYPLFKLFLYVLLLAFPIGTIISYLTLSYMKKHQIKRYFGSRSLVAS